MVGVYERIGDGEALQQADLDELEECWRQAGAPIVGMLRKGLDDDAVDVVTAPLGIQLAEEARRWWRWHNGAQPHAPGFGPAEISPDRGFLSLQGAVEVTVGWRGAYEQIAEDLIASNLVPNYEPDWKPEFLALDTGKRPAVLVSSDPGRGVVPVRGFSTEDPDSGTRLRSLGALVRLWIQAFRAEAYRWDPSKGYWKMDLETLEALEMTDLL